MKFATITITSVILLGCDPNLDIWEAADEGNIKEIKRQLDFGKDVNSKNQFGATPLHFAAKQGHKNLAALLITEGADTNAAAYDKSTPLHSAVISGYKEVAEQLIANGADVNAKGYEGSTPLDKAIEFKHSDTAAVAGAKSITCRLFGKFLKLFLQIIPLVEGTIVPINAVLRLIGKFADAKFLTAACVPASHSNGPWY